ncbi:hypothetical protein BD779DRAFT_1543637 [Infundibulicybe gibba]|nr:hypothetical protein BD779DRAFT_1543637 [Infundibulicybe gibba]
MQLTHPAVDDSLSPSYDEPGTVLHIVRDLRGDDYNAFVEEQDHTPHRAPPTRRRALPRVPTQPTPYLPTYSHEIQDLARSLARHPDRGVFSPIWGDILAHWFPPEEAFEIERNWNDISTSVLSYAVLHGGRPLRARAAANQFFDDIAPYSHHDTMCVVSALGLNWNAFVRPTYLKSEDAQLVLGYDWFGEWEEDVISVTSFEVLGRCFRDIKESCLLCD